MNIKETAERLLIWRKLYFFCKVEPEELNELVGGVLREFEFSQIKVKTRRKYVWFYKRGDMFSVLVEPSGIADKDLAHRFNSAVVITVTSPNFVAEIWKKIIGQVLSQLQREPILIGALRAGEGKIRELLEITI